MAGPSTPTADMARAAERRRLALVLVAAVFCAAVAVAVDFEPIRIFAAAPLALVLPGWALTAATFAPGAIPRALRWLMVLALSLAVLVLGALILDQTSGIREVPWAILLVVVTFAGCAAAWLRRADPQPQAPLRRPRVRATEVALLVGAVLCVGAATVIARTTLPAENIVGFTSLSLLHAEADGDPGLKAEVASNERVPVKYKLIFRQGAGPARVAKRFTLAPGDRYETFVPLSRFSEDRRIRLVTAFLYRLDRPFKPYRRVNAWINTG